MAGHHGSKYATSETLLAAVDPDAVAISVGYNNYGHPTPETLGRIQALGGGGLPHRLRGAHHLHSPRGGRNHKPYGQTHDKAAGQAAYRKLKQDLRQGTVGSLYLFHGEEAYLRDHYLDQMKAKLIPPGMESFNYHRLAGKTLTAQRLAETVDALPMMSPRTLIVVQDYDLFKAPEGSGKPSPNSWRTCRNTAAWSLSMTPWPISGMPA